MRTIFAILVFCVVASPAYSLTLGGAKVQTVMGSAEWTLPGEASVQRVARDQELPLNAVVTTYEKSLLLILMPGESKVKVGPNSKIALESFIEKSGTGVTRILLESGSVFSKIPKQKVGEKFELRTAKAAMGVRGTEFFAALSGKKSAEPDLWMCVNEGEVAISNIHDSNHFVVKKGQGVLAKPGKPIGKPREFSWTKKLNWNMDPQVGELKNEVSIDSAYYNLLEQNYD